MTTKLAPRFIGYVKGSKEAPIVIEAFVDCLCPFSVKLVNNLLPIVDKKQDKLQLRLVHYIQPWHAQATYCAYNVAYAYLTKGDEAAVNAFTAIANNIEKFSDSALADKTVNQIKKEIADVTGVTEDPDLQQKADRLIKNTQKYGRQQSIHITPTISINGLVESEPSSSWNEQQWLNFLNPICQ